MATQRLCSIPGCGKRHEGLGLCQNHRRQRTRKSRSRGLERCPANGPRAWIRAHINHAGDDCLIWPFRRTKDGYGVASFQSKTIVASRLMCLRAHGDPPTLVHQAAHSCGRGIDGCCNPKHLRWATPTENAQDKVVHGTIASINFISDDDVRAIRLSSASGSVLAKRLGVHRATISKIRNGKTRTGVV